MYFIVFYSRTPLVFSILDAGGSLDRAALIVLQPHFGHLQLRRAHALPHLAERQHLLQVLDGQRACGTNESKHNRDRHTGDNGGTSAVEVVEGGESSAALNTDGFTSS